MPGSDEDEKRIKEETTATLRCIPFVQPGGSAPCFLTGAEASEVAIFAKAY
jgi:prolyl-tRNA synthetase